MRSNPIRPSHASSICHACSCRLQLYAERRNSLLERIAERRWLTSHTRSKPTPSYWPVQETGGTPTYTLLSNRSLVRLHGQDVIHFLNGLLPSKILPLSKDHSNPVYTGFLTAKGRILHDVFIYPPVDPHQEGPWYIDVDEQSASVLFAHLKKHKLRSRFRLEKVGPEEVAVGYIWPLSDRTTLSKPLQYGGQDPRPLMGTRFLAFGSYSSSTLEELRQSATESSLQDYTIHRMLSGHAEGPSELIPNAALPQESNIDFSHGIDFHKGCYLGQELTIRTHHTGVVRKRILPCQIYNEATSIPTDQTIPVYDITVSLPQPPSETNISKIKAAGGRAGRSTGKWLGGVGNIGLALCRLEMMTNIQLTAEGTSFDPQDQFSVVWEDEVADSEDRTAVRQVKIKPFVPEWLQNSIESSIKLRSERGQRKKQELEEEDEEED